MDYSQQYVMLALKNEKIKPPDMERANGTYEVLYSLYEAHKLNGVSGARIAWNLIKRVKPELTALEGSERVLLIHADELKNLSAPIYLLDEYAIYLHGFNVLAGPSGGGKSFVALDIAGKIARERGAVVYVAGEGLHGYAARWEAWKAYNRVNNAPLYFYTEAVQVMNTAELSAFIQLIAQHNPVLVVIDTLARSAVGIEENSAREIGMFVGALDTLRHTLNTSILVVHHTGKDGKIRGSSALYAAADSVLSLTNGDGRLTLRNDGDGGGKNKHAPAAPVKYLKITPYSVGEMAGAVLMEADKVTQTEDDGLTPNQQEIMNILESGPLQGKDIAEAAGISTASTYRNLAKLCQMELCTKLKDGRYALGDVDESEV